MGVFYEKYRFGCPRGYCDNFKKQKIIGKISDWVRILSGKTAYRQKYGSINRSNLDFVRSAFQKFIADYVPIINFYDGRPKLYGYLLVQQIKKLTCFLWVEFSEGFVFRRRGIFVTEL